MPHPHFNFNSPTANKKLTHPLQCYPHLLLKQKRLKKIENKPKQENEGDGGNERETEKQKEFSIVITH